MRSGAEPKIALVHDWLTGMRGGERCLEVFLKMYPNADVFTLLHQKGTTSAAIDARVRHISFLQRIPGIFKNYRYFLPLYPFAIRQFNFSGYDLVISLSHAAAKNVVVPKGVPHISYCFTPMRYIWDQAEQYFGSLTPLLWPILKALRAWDFAGARRPTAIIGISRFIAARIRRFYQRRAFVIYPPVETSWIEPIKTFQRGAAYLYAGALVPYKRVDLAIEAFNRLGEELWIVGAGPDEERLKAMAKSNITFFGRVPDEELAGFYRKARALIFPGKEDFGIIPVECMAAGRPVIGVYSGALRETVIGLRSWSSRGYLAEVVPSMATGVFFRDHGANDCEALVEAVRYFEQCEPELDPESCIEQARKFTVARFVTQWNKVLLELGLSNLVVQSELVIGEFDNQPKLTKVATS